MDVNFERKQQNRINKNNMNMECEICGYAKINRKINKTKQNLMNGERFTLYFHSITNRFIVFVRSEIKQRSRSKAEYIINKNKNVNFIIYLHIGC